MITIIGAGLSGLIAANILTRKYRFNVRIIEAQASLPNNHAALLRFRSDAVAVATGIPFRKVRVTKGIYYKGSFTTPNIKLNNLYSNKVSGRYSDRSILNTEAGERWIAPFDLIARLANGLDIQYNSIFSLARDWDGPIISTMPMPALMKVIGWQKYSVSAEKTERVEIEFPTRPIWSYRAQLTPNIDLYQTIYFPDPAVRSYRASITGNELILESMKEINSELPLTEPSVLETFGIMSTCMNPRIKHQPYGKIMPTNEEERRAFILAMTDKHEIYALGRFACWRQILLDDIVQDVDRIATWINERSRYSRRLER